MALYIKVNQDNSVVIAGTVVTDEMLEEGFKPYTGPLPTNSNTIWMKWDSEAGAVVEDVERRRADELAVIRATRDRLLKDTDWVATKALEAGTPADPAWVAYRQALRDLPDTYVVGEQIVYPVRPDGVPTVVTFGPATDPGRMDNDGNPIKEQ